MYKIFYFYSKLLMCNYYIFINTNVHIRIYLYSLLFISFKVDMTGKIMSIEEEVLS